MSEPIPARSTSFPIRKSARDSPHCETTSRPSASEGAPSPKGDPPFVPERFGQYSSSDYAKSLREFVREGVIQRENAISIKDNEPLPLTEPAQGTLLGA